MKLINILGLICLSTLNTAISADPYKITDEMSEEEQKEVRSLRYHDKFNSPWLTLNNNYKTSGPVFNYNDDSQTRYSNNLVTLMLQESHKVAVRYLEAGDHQAYYTFMIAGLAVPFHEGLYVQFRVRDNIGNPCQESINDGTKMKNANARVTFQEEILAGNNPMALPCSSFENQEVLKQVLAGGGDGSDLGVMQISTAYYQKNFFAKNLIYSTRQTLRFGLNYVLHRNYNKGFGEMLANFNKKEEYSCLKDEAGNLIPENLIKATWARYNGGQGANACRFTLRDEEGNYKDKRDRVFAANLRRTLELDQDDKPMGNQYFGMLLTPSPYLKNAIKEIVQNFKNGTNNRTHLNQIDQLSFPQK